MTLRDFFGGVASIFLLLAKIILCLMFTLYDGMVETRAKRRRTREPTEETSSAPLLEQG